ncbi:hypothetical protein P9112_013733 [Eukaryota sp. TZLM1-RC]
MFGSSGFGQQQSSSPFGGAQQPQSSAFGTQPQTSAFGTQPQTSAFGTQPQTSAFGTQPSSTFGLSQAPSFGTQPSAFGQAQTPGSTFGQPQQTTTTTPFGQTSTASTLGTQPFGTSSFNQQSTGTFGSTTAPPFGQSTQSSLFSSSQTSFGSQPQPSGPSTFTPTQDAEGKVQSIAAMNQYKGSSIEEIRFNDYKVKGKLGGSTPSMGAGIGTSQPFGTTQTTTTPFGQQQAQQPFGQQQAQQPFGQQQQPFGQTTSAFGTSSSTPFGSQSTSSTGLFGQQNQTTSSLGTTSSLFNKPSTTPLFGQQQQQQQQPTATATTPFGSTPFSQPSSTTGSSLFGKPSTTTTTPFGQQQQPQQPFGQQQQQPFGQQAQQPFGQQQQPFGQQQQTQQPFGQPSTGIFGQSTSSFAPSSTTTSFPTTPAAQQAPQPPASTTIVLPSPHPSSQPQPSPYVTSSQFGAPKPQTITSPHKKPATSIPWSQKRYRPTTPGVKLRMKASRAKTPSRQQLFDESPTLASITSEVPTKSEDVFSPTKAKKSPIKQLSINQSSSQTSQSTSFVRSIGPALDSPQPERSLAQESNPPTLSKEGYYTYPSLTELSSMDNDQLSNLSEFAIGSRGQGMIKWVGVVDVRGINFDEVVEFSNKSVTVHGSRAPSLNRPAEVLLENCYPKGGKEALEDPSKKQRFESKLRSNTNKIGAQWIGFDAENGVWKFRVDRFE